MSHIVSNQPDLLAVIIYKIAMTIIFLKVFFKIIAAFSFQLSISLIRFCKVQYVVNG